MAEEREAEPSRETTEEIFRIVIHINDTGRQNDISICYLAGVCRDRGGGSGTTLEIRMDEQPLITVSAAFALTLAVGVALVTMGRPSAVCAATQEISFSEDIFPIFKGRCIDCHQPGGQGYEKSGLDLGTYEGLMKGTKYGAMVDPGHPETSNLIWLLDWKASPELRMPHGTKKLSTCDRDAIRHWIRQGAKNN